MLFENATIITMNPKREIITHGAIAVNGSAILEVGKTKDLIEQFPHEKRINCNQLRDVRARDRKSYK